MARRSSFVVVVLMAVFALGVTACGGDDSDDVEGYESSIVETRDEVDSAFATISTAQNRKEFTNKMEQAGIRIERAADDLSEKDTPEEFEDETAKLEAALRQLSGDLEGTAEQLRLTPELFNNSEGLSFPGFTEANEVLTALGKQGITVEPLASH